MLVSNKILQSSALTALFLLFFLSPVKAADMPVYKKVGVWDIRVDTSMSNGCFAITSFEGDSVFRMGFNPESDNMYVVIGDPSWKSIDVGKSYDVDIQFGDEEKWSGDATGFEFSEEVDSAYLWLNIPSKNMSLFLDEYMREHSVRLFYQNNQILHLRLNGSYKAGVALMECQKMFKSKDSASDPFTAPSSSRKSDPFAL